MGSEEIDSHRMRLLASQSRFAPRFPNAVTKFSLTFGMLFIVAIISACSDTPSSKVNGLVSNYQVDPIFREYYNYLGGMGLLGPAISPARTEGSATTQFLETGKLVFDLSAPVSSRFRLEPLGLEMDVTEPPVQQPKNADIHYVAGHSIPPEFYLLYERIGAGTVGKPLTEPRFNMIRRRYEQYFENLGFYRIEGTSDVHLLAYGIWVCGQKCMPEPTSGEATIDIRSYIDPAFQEFVKKYGADFTGFALTSAYQTSDGKWMQILENVVLEADSRLDPKEIMIQPLSQKVNVITEEPQPRQGGSGMYFYPLQDGSGYEIPFYFWDYIDSHGGFSIFGPPITHYSPLMKEIYHQCFKNLCLSYNPSAIEGARVRPEPLGYAYKVLYYQPSTQEPPVSTVKSMPTFTAVPEVELSQDSMREISLRVWQRYLVMEQKQGQEIEIWVEENNQPVADKVVELTVKIPDQMEQVFQMPPTNASGQTSFLLPEIKALNGTIVPFKACYVAAQDLKVCVADIFVIWNNP
jgi:hypothetical protein